MSNHLTLVELDRLAEAESPSSPHLLECERCRGEVALMKEAHARFRGDVFKRTAPEVARRSTVRWWRLAVPLVLAPALGIALVMLRPGQPAEPTYGVKGAPTLRVVVQRQHGAQEVLNGAHLAAGDALRFEIQPGGFPYLLVGSVAVGEEPGILFPMNAEASGRVDPALELVLPGSAILDEAKGPERVFALLSRQPIPTEVARAAMRALAERGPAALRSTAALSGVPADSQASLFWEKAP